MPTDRSLFKAKARARKAWDLRMALERHLPRGTKPSAQLELARQLDAARWADIAAGADINPPSEETVAMVIGLLEAAARTEDLDPFADLS